MKDGRGFFSPKLFGIGDFNGLISDLNTDRCVAGTGDDDAVKPGFFKLGAQLLLNLPGDYSIISYLLGKGLQSFISTSQWEPPPTSHMEHPVMQVQVPPHSLPIKDFYLRQLILRKLQLSNPTAIPPFHSVVESACQQI